MSKNGYIRLIPRKSPQKMFISNNWQLNVCTRMTHWISLISKTLLSQFFQRDSQSDREWAEWDLKHTATDVQSVESTLLWCNNWHFYYVYLCHCKHNTSYICELIDTEMTVTYQYTSYAELKPLTLLKWAMVCFTA